MLTAFVFSYRFTIAYGLAIILLVSMAVVLLRKVLGNRIPALSSGSLYNDWNNSIIGGLHLKKILPVFALLVIFLAWAPNLFRGQDVHVKIFDNLDSHVPHSKTLADSGKAFSLNPDTRLENILNGIHLSGVDSGYNVMTWLFVLFPPFVAFALNELLMRLVAFFGMMLLLRRHVFKAEDNFYWIITGASLCFALIPFYPGGGLSVAGLPLIWNSFLNIKTKQWTWKDFLIIFIFPFYSRLALAGVFIAITLTMLFLWDFWQNKKINVYFLGGLALLTVTYVFTHFQLLYSFVDPNFTSFREEIRMTGVPTGKALKNSVHNFLFDRINVIGAQQLFVIGAAALAMVMGALKKVIVKPIVLLVSTMLVTSLLWGFKYWTTVIPIREKFQFINAFDLSRFYWFNPFVWYIVFALALLVISKHIKWGKVTAIFLIAGQVLFMFLNYNWEYRHTFGIPGSFAGSRLTYSLTFREFYSEKLFKEIADFIGMAKQDYRVANLGLHPGITQFNGFYTLDTYTDVYSLQYKHRIRKVMEKELARSQRLRRGFDSNAKRCFLLSAQLHGQQKTRGMAFSRGITKHEKNLKLENLEFNADAFKELGGTYLFSAVEILNSEKTGFRLEKVFHNKKSPWRIYLYKVI